ncbi:hypothetical protein ACFOVU_20055 [Nocardiopsis sediminis]|uniref:Uncharacterized protein n=1 Tax=Nocardiopsis sediminis TaxID=1778267 RepID=A0ABV8FPX3_9ACTN
MRAARQPLVGGQRAEFAVEHRKAAALRRRYPGLVVWFGEATHSYWAATADGLVESADIRTLPAMVRLSSPADEPMRSAQRRASVVQRDRVQPADRPRPARVRPWSGRRLRVVGAADRGSPREWRRKDVVIG